MNKLILFSFADKILFIWNNPMYILNWAMNIIGTITLIDQK